MPKASKDSASHVEDMGVMEGRYEELDGYTVGFETFHEQADGTPLFRSLPDDRCQSLHWGYVISGSVTFRYADAEETYETGDAYYAPPGHVPVIAAGTEIVEFSPTDEYEKTMAIVGKKPRRVADLVTVAHLMARAPRRGSRRGQPAGPIFLTSGRNRPRRDRPSRRQHGFEHQLDPRPGREDSYLLLSVAYLVIVWTLSLAIRRLESRLALPGRA